MAPPSAEPARDGRAAALLALTIFLAPALGVPSELVLQDTLKSAIVSFGGLGAAALFLWSQRTREAPLRWHAALWLPVVLCVAALGGMLWAHRYLAGVEAIRWFVFAVIAWVALNTFSRERLPMLAWAIHAGAMMAALWAALQFWFDFTFFPQGPPPASTFINRNFLAEFVVCALPFSALLLARARSAGALVALAASVGFLVTVLLMTGTRAALVALWLQLFAVWPLVLWRCRKALPCANWPRAWGVLALAAALGTVLALGSVPTRNERILEEGQGSTPIARGLQRTQSIGPSAPTLNMRVVMWKATLTAIRAEPIRGLGAGAWEAKIPLYQAEGSQLETDYYVHNEFLQLVAEYGLVGWFFLLLLAAYLLAATWRSLRAAGDEGDAERPWRAVLLCSVLALLVVSNIGFPWRLATTGALFALCLGALAASDARLGLGGGLFAGSLRWSPRIATGALAAAIACLLLAAFITERAAAAERKLVRAANIAMAISRSGQPNDPRFDPMKREMLQLLQEGVAINRHYRKITPIVGDELARWGDWYRATWVWESVLSSRPYIVAIITNAARGYSAIGRNDIALDYLERARKLQPRAPAVRSLEVILLARMGKESLAARKARESIEQGIVDQDLVNTAYLLALHAKDYALARRMLERRMEQWPETRALGLQQLHQLQLLEAQARPDQTSARSK